MCRYLLVLLLLSTVSAFADDKPTQEPAALVQARKVYEAKVKAAVDPIRAAYLKQLDEMKKAFGAKGDLASAQAVQSEINSLGTPATIVGKWNLAANNYSVEFKADGTATTNTGPTAKWRCLDKKARTYQASWSNGDVALMLLSSDGSTLSVKNTRSIKKTQDAPYTLQRLQEP
jgi:hypothetical protein